MPFLQSVTADGDDLARFSLLRYDWYVIRLLVFTGCRRGCCFFRRFVPLFLRLFLLLTLSTDLANSRHAIDLFYPVDQVRLNSGKRKSAPSSISIIARRLISESDVTALFLFGRRLPSTRTSPSSSSSSEYTTPFLTVEAAAVLGLTFAGSDSDSESRSVSKSGFLFIPR